MRYQEVLSPEVVDMLWDATFVYDKRGDEPFDLLIFSRQEDRDLVAKALREAGIEILPDTNPTVGELLDNPQHPQRERELFIITAHPSKLWVCDYLVHYCCGSVEEAVETALSERSTEFTYLADPERFKNQIERAESPKAPVSERQELGGRFLRELATYGNIEIILNAAGLPSGVQVLTMASEQDRMLMAAVEAFDIPIDSGNPWPREHDGEHQYSSTIGHMDENQPRLIAALGQKTWGRLVAEATQREIVAKGRADGELGQLHHGGQTPDTPTLP